MRSRLLQAQGPFYMDFNPEYSGITDTILASNWASSVTNVTLYVGAQLTTNQTAYSDLTTSNLNHYVASGTYTVTGTITNAGSQTVGDVWAVTTFYDASGTVVAINYTDYLDPSGSLTPGDGVSVTATPADNTAALTSKITNYSMLVESSQYSGPSVTPTPYSPSHANTYSDLDFLIFHKGPLYSNKLFMDVWCCGCSSNNCRCPRRFDAA